MTLEISTVAIPTGGAIAIKFKTAKEGIITLARAAYGTTGLSPFITIYSGEPFNFRGDVQFFLDLGEDLQGPLPATSRYVYQLTDLSGSIQSAPIMPVYSIDLDRTDFVTVMIRLIQGSINAANLPEGIQRSRVVQAMPLSGLPPMPFVTINPDLVQQEDVPIGQDIVVNDAESVGIARQKVWTRTEFANRVFRISIFSLNAEERDYYRDLIIATFKISLGYVFAELGLDITHRYQANSFQLVRAADGMNPGFYGADIMCEFLGTSNVSVVTTFGTGLIEEIDTFATSPAEAATQVTDETNTIASSPAFLYGEGVMIVETS